MHIEDISRAFLAMLEAPRELVHDQAFNVGRAGGQRAGPRHRRDGPRRGAGLHGIAGRGAGPDLRNYRVDFSKLAGTFPDLSLRWSVREGVDELASAYAKYGLTHDDFTSSRFVRLRRIRELLSAGLVDEMLRRKTDQPLPAAATEITSQGH